VEEERAAVFKPEPKASTAPSADDSRSSVVDGIFICNGINYEDNIVACCDGSPVQVVNDVVARTAGGAGCQNATREREGELFRHLSIY